MTNLSKQDVQNVVDSAKNQLLQRVVTRQDFQYINDSLKVMINALQQNQQLLRQSEYQRVQMFRRTVAVEARLAQLEQEMKTVRTALERLSERQPDRVIMPVAEATASQSPESRYLYNPTPNAA